MILQHGFTSSSDDFCLNIPEHALGKQSMDAINLKTQVFYCYFQHMYLPMLAMTFGFQIFGEIFIQRIIRPKVRSIQAFGILPIMKSEYLIIQLLLTMCSSKQATRRFLRSHILWEPAKWWFCYRWNRNIIKKLPLPLLCLQSDILKNRILWAEFWIRYYKYVQRLVLFIL